MTMKSKINQKENQIVFLLNTKTYPLEAIYSTAYVFLDRAYVFLDGDPAKEVIIFLKGKRKLNKKQLQALKGEFCNELLNYLLRVEIAKRNKKIREFIIGTALVSALPFSKDPLEIAIPWEKKYKKSSKKKKQDAH